MCWITKAIFRQYVLKVSIEILFSVELTFIVTLTYCLVKHLVKNRNVYDEDIMKALWLFLSMGHFSPCKLDYSTEKPSHWEKNSPVCLICLHASSAS